MPKNPNRPFSTKEKKMYSWMFKYNKIKNQKDKSCVNKYDITSDYKYSIIDENSINEEKIVIESCKNQCDNYYSLQDYICSSKFIFLISDKISNDKCLQG